jgi:hypothetical protein
VTASVAYRAVLDVCRETVLFLSSKPSLRAALLAAKMAGHTHIQIDGTLLETDRCRIPGPTPGVDLWWSGKHHHHGGNIQVVCTPGGWPLWTSDVRPGREHDTTCLHAHDEILPALRKWTGDQRPALAGLGYEGEDLLILPIKKPAGGRVDRRPTPAQLAARVRPSPRRTGQLRPQDHLQGATPDQPVA